MWDRRAAQTGIYAALGRPSVALHSLKVEPCARGVAFGMGVAQGPAFIPLTVPSHAPL